TDLLNALCSEAPDIKWWAMVMNDTPEGYPYPQRVRFELDYKKISDYRLAADFLNMNQVDVVCLQHEFGIFGGQNGRHILEFINNLRMPVATTLHTVLREPDPGQKKTLEEIGRIGGRLIVMSKKAEAILKETYSIPEEKIGLTHQGLQDILRLACGEKLRLELGENLKKYLDEVVSWEVIVKQYNEAYNLANEAKATGKPVMIEPEF
ncbi:MAG: hypothetical protein JW932_13110, partial [Deltaproteobacteria bacterium]|nr:hypothetical protein [Deltaproteobacteria bacterium]